MNSQTVRFPNVGLHFVCSEICINHSVFHRCDDEMSMFRHQGCVQAKTTTS